MPCFALNVVIWSILLGCLKSNDTCFKVVKAHVTLVCAWRVLTCCTPNIYNKVLFVKNKILPVVLFIKNLNNFVKQFPKIVNREIKKKIGNIPIIVTDSELII